MPIKYHRITFNLLRNLEGFVYVKKKTKKINKNFKIPNSVIRSRYDYSVTRGGDFMGKYEVKRVRLTLPRQYCLDELGFCI
jgi:hypothetical protein